MKFLLYGHGGAYNHGAEAIVQTTAHIIREACKDAEIILSTHFKEQDVQFNIPVDKVIQKDEVYFELDKQCERKGTYNKQIYKEALSYIDSETICLSVGGDNYCYGTEHRLYTFHQQAIVKGAKSILWGCSIEPELINEEMLKNLRTHDCIIARESLTYEALLERNLTNVKLIPDPAFILKPTKVALPSNFQEGNTVGINISPLVIRKEQEKGIVIRNILELIKFIITQTDMCIALIPHVVMNVDNDYELLKEIYKTLDEEDRRRVLLISKEYSAAQYKYIVSKCRFVISARTHVAIAAYSSCIPTLAIGYSIKALGLAKDIMESTTKYNISIEEMREENSLLEKFNKLLKDEVKIKEHLSNTMPSYIESVARLKKILIELTD